MACLLSTAPAALAHGPAGTPNPGCEDAWDRLFHDYGPPAAGLILSGPSDGSIAACGPEIYSTDGHSEYARGGAWILVESGDGWTGGTWACFGEEGHHPRPLSLSVEDAALGPGAPFFVTADQVNPSGPDPFGQDCGDYESDVVMRCVGGCFVTFAPGLDGSYAVFVGDVANRSVATQGHVLVNAHVDGCVLQCFLGPFASAGRIVLTRTELPDGSAVHDFEATYGPTGWDCRSTPAPLVPQPPGAGSTAKVTCSPPSCFFCEWPCARATLTATALGPDARVRGTMDCRSGATLSTGDVEGDAMPASASGDLGYLGAVECATLALSDGSPPAGSYVVTCEIL